MTKFILAIIQNELCHRVRSGAGSGQSRRHEPAKPVDAEVTSTPSESHRCAGCLSRDRGFCSRLPGQVMERFREAARTIGGERLTDDNGAPAGEWDVAVIVCGSALVRCSFEDGRRAITDYLFPGELLLVDGERARRGRQITTSSDFQACLIPKLDAVLDAEDVHCLEGHIRGDAVAHIEDLRDMIAVLARLGPKERLAHLLCGLREKLNPGGSSIRLPFSRSDIADLIGIRVETVSRALLDLEEADLIRRDGPKTIEFLNVDALAAVASG